MKVIDHWDSNQENGNFDLYCENAYCANFATFYDGLALRVIGTAVNSITSEQCMDMCLCDEGCIIFAWAEYSCFDGAEELEIPCAMCRIYLDHDENDPFGDFYAFNFDASFDATSSLVGTKNESFFTSPFSYCNDPSACENPSAFSGSTALEELGNGTSCQAIMFGTLNG